MSDSTRSAQIWNVPPLAQSGVFTNTIISEVGLPCSSWVRPSRSEAFLADARGWASRQCYIRTPTSPLSPNHRTEVPDPAKFYWVHKRLNSTNLERRKTGWNQCLPARPVRVPVGQVPMRSQQFERNFQSRSLFEGTSQSTERSTNSPHCERKKWSSTKHSHKQEIRKHARRNTFWNDWSKKNSLFIGQRSSKIAFTWISDISNEPPSYKNLNPFGRHNSFQFVRTLRLQTKRNTETPSATQLTRTSDTPDSSRRERQRNMRGPAPLLSCRFQPHSSRPLANSAPPKTGNPPRRCHPINWVFKMYFRNCCFFSCRSKHKRCVGHALHGKTNWQKAATDLPPPDPLVKQQTQVTDHGGRQTHVLGFRQQAAVFMGRKRLWKVAQDRQSVRQNLLAMIGEQYIQCSPVAFLCAES